MLYSSNIAEYEETLKTAGLDLTRDVLSTSRSNLLKFSAEEKVLLAVFTSSVPVAQWWSIALAAQRLWVRFPENTHTDKNMYNLNVL